jgi:hypothetical protein
MKEILFVFCLLLSVVTISAKADEEQSLTKQLTAYTAEYDQLLAGRAALAKRSTALKDAQGMVFKQMSDYKTDRANLDTRMAEQQRVIKEHTARGQVSNPSEAYVNAYNDEAARINAKTNALTQEEDALNRRLELVKTAVQTQIEETDKVAAADKAAINRQIVLKGLMLPIIARLKAIMTGEVDPCKAAIAAVDAHPDNDITNQRLREIMHARCGQMFDGNR